MDKQPSAKSIVAKARQRNPDGTWPAETLFVAGNTARPGLWHYQSWAVVTAMCVRALVVAGGEGE